ncbi:MAG: hypothetical protein A2103_02355 [Gammaproteobacteria bacterium GWF2_41_13]|nr:MAG: hypothetical protein A2103_02355 [Gammaproteobacteria bacterium GWF2_41_13]
MCRLIKTSGLLMLLFCLPVIANEVDLAHKLYANNLKLQVINTTRERGHFDVCSGPIQEGRRTICSSIQLLRKGNNRIFIPEYSLIYPVFTDSNEQTYTCGTQENPTQPLSFSPDVMRKNTLILDSFILDKAGNRIAVLCILQGGNGK